MCYLLVGVCNYDGTAFDYVCICVTLQRPVLSVTRSLSLHLCRSSLLSFAHCHLPMNVYACVCAWICLCAAGLQCGAQVMQCLYFNMNILWWEERIQLLALRTSTYIKTDYPFFQNERISSWYSKPCRMHSCCM